MEPNYRYKALVDRVVDGDTFVADLDLGFRVKTVQRIRLLGCDTSELRSKDEDQRKRALKALKKVSETILHQVVLVETKSQDSFGRWLSIVYCRIDGEWKCLNEWLLLTGLAIPYVKGQNCE